MTAERRLMRLYALVENIMDEGTPAADAPSAAERAMFRYFFARGAHAALAVLFAGQRCGLDDAADARLGALVDEIEEEGARYSALATIDRARYRSQP